MITVSFFHSDILRLGDRKRRRRLEAQAVRDVGQRTRVGTGMPGRVGRDVRRDRGAPGAERERPVPADPRRIPLSRPRRLLPHQPGAGPEEILL